jgi:phytoene dehydrogenase-like protein
MGSVSTFDLMEELFEHDKVKAHFGRVAGENLVSPDEKATGIGAYVFLGFLEKFGFGVPVGGSGSLTDALIACIEDHGGAVRAGGRARGGDRRRGRTGVVLDGERLSMQRRRHRRDPPACAARHGAIAAGQRREECRSARTSPTPPASPSMPRSMRR